MSRADQSHRRRKNPLAAVFRAVGIILLIAIIAICVPLIVPKTMGYQLYTVVSGSMEPAIPTGSLVYVKYIQPEEIQTEDVIAFYGTDADGSIVTHRVVSNSAAIFKRLAQNNLLCGLARNDFIAALVDLYQRTNELHPFREGNGRTQRVFLSQLAENAGYDLDFTAVDPDELMIATIYAAQGIEAPLQQAFEKIVQNEE